MARSPVALYLHVPFCLSLCPYCDFVVYSGRDARGPASRVDAFVAALMVELDARAAVLDARFGTARPPLRSVFLGGGTPSLLSASVVHTLLDRVDRRFGLATGAEVTIEVNPGPADRGDLAGFRAAGVDRLSIGVQSLDAVELRTLGRRHGPGDVAEAVRAARAAGYRSVSLDLLYDVPGQTAGSWRATLAGTLALQPDHVSAYALSLDDPDGEGLTGPTGDHLTVSPGARAWRRRARQRQDEDLAAELYGVAWRLLTDAGYGGYELSSWAQPGHECRHNLAYWRREPYEALGPGAHAFDGHLERRWNAARLDTYLAALLPADGVDATLPPGGLERLDEAEAGAEAAILGLRLSHGVDPVLLQDPRLSDGLRWASAAGLVELAGGRLRLTQAGRLLGNEVFVRLLPDHPAGAAGDRRQDAAA